MNSKNTLSNKIGLMVMTLFVLPALIFLVVFAVTLAFYWKSFSRSVCLNLERISSDVSFQIGRELALGENETAEALVSNFEQDLQPFSPTKTVRLSVKKDDAAAPDWACSLNFDSVTFARSLQFGDSRLASMTGSIRIFNFRVLLLGTFVVLLIALGVWLVVTRRILATIGRDVIEPLQSLAESGFMKGERYVPVEIEAIQTALQESHNRLLTNNQLMGELRSQRDLMTLARQVSHDIRSPVTALNLVVAKLSNMTEDQRRLIEGAIHRISGISDTLLKRSRTSSTQGLGASLREIVAEKLIEIDNPDVKITFQDRSTRRLAGALDHVKLQSIISNLMNNAVESLVGGKGEVSLSLSDHQGKAVIELVDNGCGMDEDFVASLGKKQVTTKEHGNGLGVFDAVEAIAKVGGRLRFFSEKNVGTRVEIEIPYLGG